MPDLQTLLNKFLQSFYVGTLYSNPFGATSVGIPVIQAVGRATAQNAAVASVVAFTVGVADGTFEVSANAMVTVATSLSFVVTVTYTSESNLSTALNFDFSTTAGQYTTSLTTASGAIAYAGRPLSIRAKAGTTITISTSGTFTTVTYNVEGLIKQVA